MIYDYIIIGGGIVGVSTAWQLQQRQPSKTILLIEKEADFATHQTGRNSGVIHAGVYYPPTSLKGQFCRQGSVATIQFCRDHDIEFEQCGKLLVATDQLELRRMRALYRRCQDNAVEVELLNSSQLKQQEPNITGLGAILVKSTAIVDYRQIVKQMVENFDRLGGISMLNAQLIAIAEYSDGVTLTVNLSGQEVEFHTRFVITCAGLMSDRLARMMGINTEFRIVPYRGEYYRLPTDYNNLIQHLIYPIPDPNLPFLGIHLTRMVDGTITIGPNAVQGWKREGYGKWNVNWLDTIEMLTFQGFWQASWQHLGAGIAELKNSWFKSCYIRQVQKYCPQLQVEDLQPYPVGVRAQAVMKNGELQQDFLFAGSRHSLHVCNAPSPAATAAIPIGKFICDKVLL